MRSRLGRWLGYLALPWFFVAAASIDTVLTAAGFQPGERPDWVKYLILGIALAPMAVYVLISPFKRLPGWRSLVAQPQPAIVLDPEGLEVQLPDVGLRRFRWEEIGTMRIRHAFLSTSADLQDPEGRRLAVIPESLIHPGGTHWWETVDTLAEAVVKARPDRYALTGPKSLATLPNEFSLRGTGPELDVATWRRRRNLVGGVLVVLSMLTIWFVLTDPLG